MQADIAILPPSADLASKFGFQRDPFPRTAYPAYLFKLWEAIHQNGSGCDYLSEEILSRSTVTQGRLVFQGRSYKALLLPHVESLHPTTADRLHAFVESGGTVLFLDTTPHLASGFVEQQANTKKVFDSITTMRRRHPLRTPMLSVNESDLVNWYREAQERYSLQPEVRISSPTDFISQIHYRRGTQDIFFFTHYGPQGKHTFDANFNTGGKTAWLWDTESGTRSPLPVKTAKNILTLSLGPSESKLIVFEPSNPNSAADSKHTRFLRAESATASRRHRIAGPWNVALAHVNGKKTALVLRTLPDSNQHQDSNQRQELRDFAGTMVYSKQIDLDSSTMPRRLDLGQIHAISELEINGQPLGTRWYGEHLYDISGALVPGTNNISIRIVTTLGNYMKTLKDNPAAQTWTSETPFYPQGLTQPVQLVF